MRLDILGERLGCRLDGDGTIEIQRLAGIETAGPADLTFFANPKYTAALRATRAGAVILSEDGESAPCAMLRTKNPYLAFARAMEIFADPWRPPAGRARARVDCGRKHDRAGRIDRSVRGRRRRGEHRTALDRLSARRDRPARPRR